MNDEARFLYGLGIAFSGISSIPQPTDLRDELATNPGGRQWKKRIVVDLQGLVVHQAMGNYRLEGIAKYHTSKKCHLVSGGVESIAYTIGIRSNGEVAILNDFDKVTWSQGCRGIEGDENARYIAVVLEGLFDYDGCINPNAKEPTSEQMTSLLLLWDYCKGKWNWRSDQIYGHYHFGKPACSGKTLRGVIEALKRGGM